MPDKLIATLEIKSLYINVLANKYLNILKEHLSQTKVNLTQPISKIIKICQLFTNQCDFTFKNNFYKQEFEIPMYSTVNGILTCLFLKSFLNLVISRVFYLNNHHIYDILNKLY